MTSRLASATIPTFLDRAFPPANRDAYHRLGAKLAQILDQIVCE